MGARQVPTVVARAGGLNPMFAACVRFVVRVAPSPSPGFLRRFAVVRIAWWGLSMPMVALVFVLLPGVWKAVSVLYLIEISLYANLATELGVWQSTKVEVHQVEEADDAQPQGEQDPGA